MKKVNFTEERRGYDKAQVEKYISLLQSAVEELEENVKKKEEECTDKQQELAKAVSENNRLKQETVSKDREIAKVKETMTVRLSELSGECSRKEKELSDMKSRVAGFQETIKQLQEQADTKETQNQLLTDELKRIRDNLLEKEGTGHTEAEQDTNIAALFSQLEDITKERDALKEELRNNKESFGAETSSMQGMEELFRQAKETADAYVKNVQSQVQKDRDHIEQENKRLVQEANEEAARILEEARLAKQTELDEKLSQLTKLEAEKKSEAAELIQNANDELESARMEAEGIRNQAKQILEQAEKRRERILMRAREKAEEVSGPVRENCDKMKKELEEAAERFAEFFKKLNLEDIE
ncbi:hypothetical protein DWX43_17005 [Clostridium sp. AF19-22AC]|jgi:chromosome segregation ATPase|uniref:hypothetical protein n=1 Tax=Clostridia TaxID=186801 RepID=UPI000E54DCFE|nr:MULTISPECIES: hypothetical protein [Clostridia]RHR25824.1 hypothetical protein DWX43_17005 [Clostridium sp. AF19-22AC]